MDYVYITVCSRARWLAVCCLLSFGVKAQDLASVQSMPPTSQTAAPLAVIITGTVKGENNESLPGVNVLLKGSATGTATNAEGRYSLSAPDGNGTLVFSFIGYLTQEVPVNNRSEINVPLQSDTKALSEVVVVGYGTQQKKRRHWSKTLDINGSAAGQISYIIAEGSITL